MGIYRTYFDKNSAIIKDSEINTGRNPVAELYFGNRVSRFLLYCSFDEIKKKVDDKEINLTGGTKHYLHIKNTSNSDISKILSDSNNLLFGSDFRSSSFDLELRATKEFWDEGMGYDFKLHELSAPQNRNYNEEPTNWFHGTRTTTFLTPGVTLSDIIDTQHFDQGNEDILMDVTDFVNNILINGIVTGVTSGGTSGETSGITYNYQGFCLKYTTDYEEFTDANRTYMLGLFTRHTQTFFEPFIETIYDDYIDDSRVDFYLNKVNKLYLYVNVDGTMTNLDELPTCTIGNTSYPVTQQTKGVYYITVNATGNTFDSYTDYHDVWSNILINGIGRSNITLEFVPKEDNDFYQMGSDIMEPAFYGVSLSGIRREEKLHQGENRKIFVHLRKPYTVEQHDVVTKVFYSLYVKQGLNQVQVLDWQKVNKIYNSNSFNIDTTWLVPQTYYVDIKIERNGEINLYNEELKFMVVNKMVY